MARPLRIQYPGAVYHVIVMARGSHGQEIFQDNHDRQRFLETLGEAAAKVESREPDESAAGAKAASAPAQAGAAANWSRAMKQTGWSYFQDWHPTFPLKTAFDPDAVM